VTEETRSTVAPGGEKKPGPNKELDTVYSEESNKKTCKLGRTLFCEGTDPTTQWKKEKKKIRRDAPERRDEKDHRGSKTEARRLYQQTWFDRKQWGKPGRESTNDIVGIEGETKNKTIGL